MKLRKLLVLLLVFVAAFVLSACGEAGIAGLTGAKGPQGETGAQGAKGAVGDTGEQGAKGEVGANGVGIEFSFTSEGLAWRQVGTETWNIGLEYKDIFKYLRSYDEAVIKEGFDYYVNPSLKDAAANENITKYGKSLQVGVNAFGSLADAFAAAKVAAAEETYAGLKIFAEKGVYAEEVKLEANNVTLYGPNFNVDPINGERYDEAILDGAIYVAADGFTIKGFCLAGTNVESTMEVIGKAGTALLKASTTTGIFGYTNLTFAHGVKDQKVLYCTTAEGTDGTAETSTIGKKQHMILFAGDCENFELAHCLIYPKRTGGDVRPFINQNGISKNFDIHNNYFNYCETADNYDDVIRLDNIDGDLIIEANVFDGWVNQSTLFLGNSGNTANIYIRGNKFGYFGELDGGHGSGLWIRNTSLMAAAGKEIVIENNDFEAIAGPMIVLRAKGEVVAAEGYAVSIKNNIFNYTADYLAVQKTGSSDVDDVTKALIALDSNFYLDTDAARVAGIVDANPVATADEVEKFPLAYRLRNAYVADYIAYGLPENMREGRDWQILDTNYGESSWMVTMLSNEEMNEKWAWLYAAMAEVVGNADMANPDADNATSLKPVMLANLYGLFSGTQHKDTWLEYDSIDWADEANVQAVLNAAPQALK